MWLTNKRYRKPKNQSGMDNPETHATPTWHTRQNEDKQSKNTTQNTEKIIHTDPTKTRRWTQVPYRVVWVSHVTNRNQNHKRKVLMVLVDIHLPPTRSRIRQFKITNASCWNVYIIRCYTHCVLLFRENKALQFVEDSVLIGDSPNLGEVAVINGNPVSIGRSFPRGMSRWVCSK